MLKLHFLRHAETDYNKNGIIQGGGVDSDLNDTGREQSRKLHEYYSQVSFDQIFTSAQKRTQQTISHFVNGVPPTQLSDFNEMNWGVLEGLKATPEMHQKYLDINDSWAAGNIGDRMEGGESPAECWQRLQNGLKIVCDRRQEGNVLVCMHGRVLRILLAEVLGYGMQYMGRFPHSNTGMNILVLHSNGKWSVDRLNDLRHLQ